MTETTPLVSIVVRTKDRPKLLQHALRSIANQTYRSIEVVLLNDGGCDLPVSQLRIILGEVPLKYVNLNKNKGRAAVGNIGLENADGDYVGFLDDDDELHPDHTETLVSFLDASDYKVAYTDAVLMYKDYDANSDEIKHAKQEAAFSEDFDYDRLIFENYIPFNCLLISKAVFIELGGLDISLDLYEDWDFLIRAGEKYPFNHITKVTATHNQWSMGLQIYQGNRDRTFMTQAYMKVVSKYIDKVNPRRIHKYVSDYARSRGLMKELQADLVNKLALISKLENDLQQKVELLSVMDAESKQKDIRICELEAEIKNNGNRNSIKNQEIENIGDTLKAKENSNRLMPSTRTWMSLTSCSRLTGKLFPVNTRRRFLAGMFARVVADPKRILRILDWTKWRRFLYELRPDTFFSSKSKFGRVSVDKNASKGLFKRGASASRFLAKATETEYFEYCFKTNMGKGEEYVELSNPVVPRTDIKLIAFYLPQFHPILENDKWCGKGFTEWTNVTRAIPQFVGHYQPHLPGELGFYDLRIPDVQRRQVELAKKYGIYGFCFHFYWFNGKTLLEMPIKQFADNCDFRFCINWENENWTGRWNGQVDDILISQKHTPDDDLNFIRHISRYLKNPNYIRIHGKPLVVVHRPALLPDARATAERWRGWCRDNGVGEIYLSTTHSFEHLDPRSINFDAAIEFPPNTFPLSDQSGHVNIVNRNFRGAIYDYADAIDYSLRFIKPPYKKFRGICPGWDNEARKPGRGTILANATPDAYRQWLGCLCEYVMENYQAEERLIFVNAWNEWAEGAYMEPDRKYGFAYLHSTAEELSYFGKESKPGSGRWKMLIVSHDASRGGAQTLLFDMLSWFSQHTFIDVKVLCLDGGEWLHLFESVGDTLVLSELKREHSSESEVLHAIRDFCGGSPHLIYGNTVAAGREYRLLGRLNAPIITHVHELEMSIQRYAADWIGDVLKGSTYFIACSRAVQENLRKNHRVEGSKIGTVHASIKTNGLSSLSSEGDKRNLKKRLGLRGESFVAFGCGIGMAFRKGADLFIDVARALRKCGLHDFQLCWIGEFALEEEIGRDRRWVDCLASLKKEGLERYVRFLGLQDSPKDYLVAGDVFVLPSREDPFPLVALEAAECGLPIICFADAGGMPDFVEDDAGFVVPYENVEDMAGKILVLSKNEDLRRKLGNRAREKLFSGFTSEKAMPHILSLCRKVADQKPGVSVIVPNYNHAQYLPRRLDSIFQQGFRDVEVILLDDNSMDNSMDVIEKYARQYPDVKVMRNEKNSGSAFKQWLKGIDIAQGGIIWIAESDDYCELDFLENMLPAFRDPAVKLAYANSYVVDEKDQVVGDYVSCEYLTSISESRWREDYKVVAEDEVNESLGIKNTILNISAVLFRKFDFSEAHRTSIENMRIAGDWYFILNAIRDGKVHYNARKLNYHRRHAESVIGKTLSQNKVEEFFREFYTVQDFIFQTYRLSDDFAGKWETYLRKQWNDFFPDRPFAELKEYYPFDAMRERLVANASDQPCRDELRADR